MGLPDSAEESRMFRLYREQQKLIEQQQIEEKPKSALDRFLIALRGKIQEQSSIYISEEDKKFTVQAEVCSLSGSKTYYQNGDIVIVGFIDNEMSSPIIIGTYLTEYMQNNRITKPYISVDSISVVQQAVLPMSATSITDPNMGTITASQIYDALRFIKLIQERGLSVDMVTTIINVIQPANGVGILQTVEKLSSIVEGLLTPTQVS